MEINWITVSAQIANFLILVGLLKKFLYKPVINSMDKREERITDRLNEAREREETAGKNIEIYQKKSEELERNRQKILEETEEEVRKKENEMLENVRREIRENRQRWKEQLEREKKLFLTSLRKKAVETIEAIVREALSQLADVELEEKIVRSFLEKLKSVDDEVREAFVKTSEPLKVTSTFEMDSSLKSLVTRTIHNELDKDIDIEYFQSSDLLCGIELTTQGQQLSWSLHEYMEVLSPRIEEAFDPIELLPEGD